MSTTEAAEIMNDTFTDDGSDEIIVGQSAEPPRLLIYGPEKAGKSSWGASSPKPIFVQTEDGLGRIGAPRYPLCKSWPEFVQRIDQVRCTTKDYQTLVIDSLDWLEKLIWQQVCKESSVKSIELASGGYGKGYQRAAEMVYWLLTERLDPIRLERGMSIILIAHSKVEKYEEPGVPAYDRASPRLHKHAQPVVCEWSDLIGYATKKIRIEEDAAAKGTRNIAHAIKGERILIVSDGRPSCVAGNRYGITEDLPLSWDAFAAAAFPVKTE